MTQTTKASKNRVFRVSVRQPKEERLAYFKAYTVAHPHLSQADDAVWNAIREPAGKLPHLRFRPNWRGENHLTGTH